MDVFQEAYAAAMRYTRAPDGFWVSVVSSHPPVTYSQGLTVSQYEHTYGMHQRNIHFHDSYVDFQGDPAYNNVDSLAAFWPGLQVLAGDVENAIQSHMTCELLVGI